MTEQEKQARINQCATDAYVSEGTYEDLVKAANGDVSAQERVILWSPFQRAGKDHVFILAAVNPLASQIGKLFKELNRKV